MSFFKKNLSDKDFLKPEDTGKAIGLAGKGFV